MGATGGASAADKGLAPLDLILHCLLVGPYNENFAVKQTQDCCAYC